MDLYLIRHADAQPLGEGGVEDDEDRPLTAVGQSQCRALAAALQRQKVQLDKLVTSPLLRARQTAEGLALHWTGTPPAQELCDHLAPGGRRRKLTRFLRDLGAESVAVVGHEPDVGAYAAWLIGSKKAQVELAKAGVARVHFDGKPGKGDGVLTWLITPEWCAGA
ncbi:MAG TPA: phosphohistidine phosphatase SixA [Gemmataceae bacterium]|jgi:phosphohistidine phosphatase|nr:phosphohistidine phosphatase SixA [Gemmataceae bacterium]